MIDAQGGGHEGLAGESAVAIGKAIPGIAASGLVVAGVPLESWVVILTVVFLVLQIAYLGYRFARDLSRGDSDCDG